MPARWAEGSNLWRVMHNSPKKVCLQDERLCLLVVHSKTHAQDCTQHLAACHIRPVCHSSLFTESSRDGRAA